MIREERGFGETVSEAIEDARAKLGDVEGQDVQIETITAPKKKVLGIFGGCRAEVRAFIEVPDKKPKKDNKKPAKKQNEVKTEKPANKPAKKVAEEKAKEPNASAPVFDDFAKDAVDESQIPADSSTGKAIAYLKGILDKLGCSDLTFKAAVKDNGAFIIIDGEGLGTIIGRRGETLDALQYLASLSANTGNGYFKVSLNIGNYREKREQTLIALAKKVSEQVVNNGRSRSLEPMNPYERRIIHTAVQEIEGVVSSSIGDGPRRHVVISPEGGETKPRRDDRRRNGRDKKPSSTVASAPTREPKKDSDMPLYGKIN